MVACPERGQAWPAEADQVPVGLIDRVRGGNSRPGPGFRPREDHPWIEFVRCDSTLRITSRWGYGGTSIRERTVNFSSGPYLDV